MEKEKKKAIKGNSRSKHNNKEKLWVFKEAVISVQKISYYDFVNDTW
jgi:hypothetical protein